MLDIEGMLAEFSPDEPCGKDLDLEYDPEYGELERASQGKPEQQLGDTFVPAEEPDWGLVRRNALKLFARTKDLRVAVILTNGAVRTEGWPGFRDSLSLIDGLLNRYWDCVHPQLDPDDGNDPTQRANLISSLCDAGTTLTYLREAPLVESVLGRFSLRDYMIAHGELTHSASEEGAPPEAAVIEAAFKAADLGGLQAIADAVTQSGAALAGIESRLLEVVGAAAAPNMSALSSLLKNAAKATSTGLASRDDAPAAVPEQARGEAIDDVAAVAVAGGRVGVALGPVANRDDVTRALDEICDYYRKQEPSSPIPILLERAKRMIGKDFMEIIQNMAPDGLSQVETLRGPEAGSEDEY